MNMDRRSFLKSAFLAASGAAVLPTLGCAMGSSSRTAQGRVIGSNDQIGYAVVGFKGRGADHITGLRKVSGTRLVALCDVDREVLDKEVRKCRDQGEQVEGYTDIRKLLENPQVDVVSIATPNHWHSLGNLGSSGGQRRIPGKPISHNVWEGRQAVKAARKYQRIVQAGTQSRSSDGIAEAIAWAREGQMGKLLLARGLCYKRRASIGKVSGPQPVPPSIDYDLWCGPAPKEPLMRQRLHYDWHWVWPTGNGDLGNQGIHQMDLARWVLGENELSPLVLSVGGRLGYVDDGTTPNTQIVFHGYKAAPLIFEVRGFPASTTNEKMDQYKGAGIGVVVEFEGGTMVIPDYSGARFIDKAGKEIKKFSGAKDHFANFIEAVRSRRPTDLKADILEGHISSALCHTGNVSYQLGRTMSSEEIRDEIRGNTDLEESLGRMEQHLAANGVKLDQTPLKLGPVLKMNPKTERFIGNRQADQLLTRNYRAPFVVPERV
jgi:predicted dehydrogenase